MAMQISAPSKKRKYVAKAKSGKPWGGGAAAYRRANMSSYMKNLWGAYPSKPTEAQLASYASSSVGDRAVTGYGDYKFSKRGQHSIGARAGAWLGDRAQSLIQRVTGLGDYSVGTNSLMGNDPPRIVNNSKRSVTISHREYLKDLITSATPGAFQTESFLLNPGDPHTFPWLSQIAPNFQEFRLDGVIFEFKTMSADALNSTNTALGQVIFATNYNPDQADFASKYEMENTEFSSSVKPSCSMLHPIECARHESVLENLYVAPGGNIPAGATDAFYNFGKTQLATNGFQAASVNVGELWVTYEITFFKPIISSPAALIGTAHLRVPAGTLASFAGPFYNPASGAGTGSIRSLAASGVLSLWTSDQDLPAGSNAQQMVGKSYLVTIIWRCTTTTNLAVGGSIIPTVANAVIVSKFGIDTFGLSGAPLPATTGPAQQAFTQNYVILVSAGASAAPVTMTYAVSPALFPTSASVGPTIDVVVVQVPSNI